MLLKLYFVCSAAAYPRWLNGGKMASQADPLRAELSAGGFWISEDTKPMTLDYVGKGKIGRRNFVTENMNREVEAEFYDSYQDMDKEPTTTTAATTGL